MTRVPSSYRVYGLAVRSPFTLPCLPARFGARIDVTFQAWGAARFVSARREVSTTKNGARRWFHSCRLPDGTTYLRWRGLFEFLISRDGRRIRYHRLQHATGESFNVYLLGQVLSFSLVALGVEPLHGTVVVIDGEAVALVGDCGSGKSTLAAALLARGFRILTDDVMALDECGGCWSVQPGIPRLKLFPRIARRLLGGDPRGTPMNPGTKKLVLPLNAGQTVDRPVPLRALYVLSGPARSERRRPRGVRIEPLTGRSAFLEVVRAAFNLLVLDRGRLANQFAFATRLVESVPVRRLSYPRRLSALPDVCDTLLADLRSLQAAVDVTAPPRRSGTGK